METLSGKSLIHFFLRFLFNDAVMPAAEPLQSALFTELLQNALKLTAAASRIGFIKLRLPPMSSGMMHKKALPCAVESLAAPCVI